MPTQRSTVEAVVPHQHEPLRCFKQWDDVFARASLDSDEPQRNWQTSIIGQCHALGIASATRVAHRLLLRSSGGIGGAWVCHPMRAIGQSNPAFGATRQSAQQSLPDALSSQSLIPATDRTPEVEAFRQVMVILGGSIWCQQAAAQAKGAALECLTLANGRCDDWFNAAR